MIRPLITALIEYMLCGLVLLKGKRYKKVIATLLFFLASYQLGEVLLFLTDGNDIGIRISYFSTTLLPPLGLLLLERINKKRYGYPLIQAIGVFFALSFFVSPELVGKYVINDYCISVFGSNDTIYRWWQTYYQGVLTLLIIIGLYNFIKEHRRRIRSSNVNLKGSGIKGKENLLVAISVISFDIPALLLSSTFPYFEDKIASLMCALAFFASFIYFKLSKAYEEIPLLNMESLKIKDLLWFTEND
jgi:hypothetical protein